MKIRVLMACRSALLITICALMLGSCSLMPQSKTNKCTAWASATNPEATTGIGGTGQVAGSPGIGGTGQVAGSPGIGGTGQVAISPGIGGTGIVGVVTGFASICVNGEEVHYTAETPVIRDGEPSSTSELMVGQLVAIRAKGNLSDPGAQLTATKIALLNAAVGPLTAIDVSSGQFEVMGQKAQALAKEDVVNLLVGDWVRVSGHRLADGTIRAGLVQRLDAPFPLAQVLGPALDIVGNTVRIGTTPVQFKLLPSGLVPGSEVVVRGTWNGNFLEVTASTLRPTHAELGTSKEVLLQGYVHSRRDNELILGYETVKLSNRTRVSGGEIEALEVDQQVLLRGRLDASQRIIAEHLTIGSNTGSAAPNRFSIPGSGYSNPSNGGFGNGEGSGGPRGGGSGGRVTDAPNTSAGSRAGTHRQDPRRTA